MQQEKKVLVLKTKETSTPAGDWQAWTPQQRADAMQKENQRFDHLKRYGRSGF